MTRDIYDQTPISLRVEDQPDAIPLLLIEHNAAMRLLLDYSLQVRDLQHKSMFSGDSRYRDLVHARLIELHELTGRACDQLERLTMALRTHGRL